jgi:hypothetical protein
VSRKIFLPVALSLCLLLAGCQSFNADQEVFRRYYLTTLKLTQSADILPVIAEDQRELLSQSESVVASWGQNKKGSILWFNMIAFDEESLAAARKYCFAVDEKARSFYIKPMQRLRFDAQIVLDEQTLTRPYAGSNEKRIDVLKKILADFKQDAAHLTFDSQTLHSASMMVNQALNTIVYKLDASPALADKLSEYPGLDFDHMTLGPAKARMIIENDIAIIKIKIGKDWFNRQNFEHHPDVINM